MGNINYRPVIIPKATIDLLLKQDKPADLMALYLFYYYTAIWQKTNQPHCTDTFVRGKFRWGRDKIIRLRKILTKIGLVELVKGKRPMGEGAGSEFSKPYVKVNYYYGAQAVKEAELRQRIAELETENNQLKSRMSENGVSDFSGVGSQDTNAYSSSSLNACSSNKEMLKEKDSDILEKDFDLFWDIYPRKVVKKKALESWNKIDFTSISADDIIKAVKKQAASPNWLNKDVQYVPHPATWLNQERWTDQVAVAPAPAYDPDEGLLTADEAFTKYSQMPCGVNYGVKPGDPDWNNGEG